MSPAVRGKPAKSTKATLAPRTAARNGKPVGHELFALGVIALGLLILLAQWMGSGAVGGAVAQAARWLFGTWGAWGVGIGLLAVGITVLSRLKHVEPSHTAVGYGLLFLVVITMAQLGCGPDALWRPGQFSAMPGGLLGSALAVALHKCFSLFAWVVLPLLGLCGLALAIETPLWAVLSWPFRLLHRRLIVPMLLSAREQRENSRYAAVQALQEEERASVPRRESAKRTEPPKAESCEEPAWLAAARERTAAHQKENAPTPVPIPVPVVETPAPALPPLAESEEEEPTRKVRGVPSARKPGQLQFSDDDVTPAQPYLLPPVEILVKPPNAGKAPKENVEGRVKTLEDTLASFGIEAKVVGVEQGPRVTRFEIVPPPGVRINRITNLADNITLALSADNVRVEAPVPGKGVVGIEVPNKELTMVSLREIIESEAAVKTKSPVAFALGRDIGGIPRMADMAKMPHLLIAGATNSGKSVCINTLICSILMRATPRQVKFLMVDPKRVELSLFQSIPHLIAPVAYDAKHAAGLLRWAIREMEQRYELFAEKGVRNIIGFNDICRLERLEELPYIVIIIDELADLMMQAAAEFESSICRIAQLARATGMHLVVATQRPSVNVITGIIKANIPSRIAFAVASQIDSRTILDMNGAERLVGMGDMLYLPVDASKPGRIQGAYVSEKEINAIVEHVKAQARPHFSDEIAAIEEEALREKDGGSGEIDTGASDDEFFERALDYIRTTKYASTSMLQRKFRIGYTRAARLMDEFEERGFVGPGQGSKPREVIFAPAGSVTGRPATDSDDYAEGDIRDPFAGDEDE